MTRDELEELGNFLLSLDDYALSENVFTTMDVRDFISETLTYIPYI